MLFFKTNTFSPALNLACEEYYLKECNDDVFMLWQNDPVVVIGKNQNIYDEVDLDYACSHGISVIRRITGGGAVYHDHGNLNYTFITSRQKAPMLDFAYFTEPILKALKSLGLNARLSGRNDLLLGDRKFSGNAQHADLTRVLHHGTLLFSSDLGVLSSVLKPAPEKLRTKKIPSVRSRVTNLCEHLPPDNNDFSFFYRAVENFVSDYFSCRIENADLCAVLSSPYYEKYTQDQWIYGRKKEYQQKKSRRFSFGTLVVCFDVNEGGISDLSLEGDFFSLTDTASLERALIGAPLDAQALHRCLETAGLSRYFPGLLPDDLVNLILA